VGIATTKANEEGSKCVTRSQMDYFGKWLQVLFLKSKIDMQMNFWMNFFKNLV
jgi:hypothetical protein